MSTKNYFALNAVSSQTNYLDKLVINWHIKEASSYDTAKFFMFFNMGGA